MKNSIIIFSLLNALFISISRAELRNKSTAVSPYFRYHKCQTTDMYFICENCDEYQPSCSSDSECGNGEACCKAQCSPSSCSQCQGILLKFRLLIKKKIILFNYLDSSVSSSRYFFL